MNRFIAFVALFTCVPLFASEFSRLITYTEPEGWDCGSTVTGLRACAPKPRNQISDFVFSIGIDIPKPTSSVLEVLGQIEGEMRSEGGEVSILQKNNISWLTSVAPNSVIPGYLTRRFVSYITSSGVPAQNQVLLVTLLMKTANSKNWISEIEREINSIKLKPGAKSEFFSSIEQTGFLALNRSNLRRQNQFYFDGFVPRDVLLTGNLPPPDKRCGPEPAVPPITASLDYHNFAAAKRKRLTCLAESLQKTTDTK